MEDSTILLVEHNPKDVLPILRTPLYETMPGIVTLTFGNVMAKGWQPPCS